MGANKVIENLTGRQFNFMSVIGMGGYSKHKKIMWECKCVCGKSTLVSGKDLKSSHTKSCGCMKASIISSNIKTHGLSKTRDYKIWQDMKARCYNPKNKDYQYYGGKGIGVCEEWLLDGIGFSNFIIDMGLSNGLTIERKDVLKNYSKDNCIWATRKEQAKNKTTSVKIEYMGVSKNLVEWASFFSVTHSTMQFHLKKRKIEDIISYFTEVKQVDYFSLLKQAMYI